MQGVVDAAGLTRQWGVEQYVRFTATSIVSNGRNWWDSGLAYVRECAIEGVETQIGPTGYAMPCDVRACAQD